MPDTPTFDGGTFLRIRQRVQSISRHRLPAEQQYRLITTTVVEAHNGDAGLMYYIAGQVTAYRYHRNGTSVDAALHLWNGVIAG
jgi:hypothetical protein